MKRIIFITIALAAMSIGCTKSNLVSVSKGQKTPIVFETYNGKTPLTKATEVTESTFEASTESAPAFRALAMLPTGAGYMDEPVWYVPAVEDNPDTEDKDETMAAYWDYDGVTYWPSDGSSLTFAAYGLNVPEDNILLSSNTLTYTVPEYAADQADLIVATPVTQDATTGGGVVSLVFKHMLSRIGFTLQTSSNGTNVTVKTIELHGNFKSSGEVDLTAEAPSIASTVNSATTSCYSLFKTGDYFETLSTDDPAAGVKIYPRYVSDGVGGYVTVDDESDRFMMIIPGEITETVDTDDIDKDKVTDEKADPYIKVVYQIAGASDQLALIPLKRSIVNADGEVTGTENWNFEAGKAYEFVFTVSVTKIEFTGSVVDWDENIDDNDDENDNDDIIVRP